MSLPSETIYLVAMTQAHTFAAQTVRNGYQPQPTMAALL